MGQIVLRHAKRAGKAAFGDLEMTGVREVAMGRETFALQFSGEESRGGACVVKRAAAFGAFAARPDRSAAS